MTHKPNPTHLPPVRSAREYEAEIAALRAMSSWQPMETAPKDGDRILLAYHAARWDRVIVASWLDEVWSGEGGPNVDAGEDCIGWQHIPAPPESSESGECATCVWTDAGKEYAAKMGLTKRCPCPDCQKGGEHE